MLASSRLVHILFFILGLAILFDTSIQIGGKPTSALVWQPVNKTTPPPFEIQAIDDRPMFVA